MIIARRYPHNSQGASERFNGTTHAIPRPMLNYILNGYFSDLFITLLSPLCQLLPLLPKGVALKASVPMSTHRSCPSSVIYNIVLG